MLFHHDKSDRGGRSGQRLLNGRINTDKASATITKAQPVKLSIKELVEEVRSAADWPLAPMYETFRAVQGQTFLLLSPVVLFCVRLIAVSGSEAAAQTRLNPNIPI